MDIHGQLWDIDFRMAGVLPESFASYVPDRIYRNRLPADARSTIPVQKSKNWMGMDWAAGFIFSGG